MSTRRAAKRRPSLLVLAGVNGSGKSSSGGAILRRHGLIWFNPDAFARKLVGLGWSRDAADSAAWHYGKGKLEEAMRQRTDFAFETTLGGRTMTGLLSAAAKTHEIVILFFGLMSVEQHIARVKLRVEHGGHDIPEERIRTRWTRSRENLIALLPRLAVLQLFDNSVDAAPGDDIPVPKLVLEMRDGQVLRPAADDRHALLQVPHWAKPIVAAALKAVR